MTISRERTTVVEEGGQATFSLPQAISGTQSPWLLVTEVARPGGTGSDRLCIIVEPVEQTARASSVGAGVVAAIRDIYASSEAGDPLKALNAAIDAANLALYQQNLTTTPGHRVLLGLTCLVQRGDELLICQVPPTQLILSQGGEPIALPDLATWARDYQPHARDDRQGLGATEVASPLLFRATIEDGDLITLCTSNVAALLAQQGDDLGPLLGTDPTDAINFLADLTEEHGLDAAYATALAPTVSDRLVFDEEYVDEDEESFDEGAQLSGQSGGWLERNLREVRERSRIIPWPRFGERHQGRDPVDEAEHADEEHLRAALETSADDARPISAMTFAPGSQHLLPEEEEGWDDGVEDPATRQAYRPQQHATASAMATSTGVEEEAEHDPLDEILPSRRRRQRPNPFQLLGSIVALPLLVVGTIGERLRPARGRRSDRYMEEGRKRVWPIGSLERYQSGGLPLGRGLPIILLAGLILFVVILLVSLRNHQARVEQGRFDTALSQVTQVREAAIASPDRQAAHIQLLALPEQLQAIPATDKPGRQDRIAAEAAAINNAIDQVDGVQRLSVNAVTTIGSLPAGVTAAGDTARPQLVVGGGKQYLFLNGTIYMGDGRGALTKILAKGDMIGGTAVGAPLGIAWRDTALFAYTETQGLSRDAAGTWTLSPLAANGRKATAVDSFDGNLYFLEAERGQIVKYAAGAYNQAPQPWSSSKVNGDLIQAVDFTIDKDIYALLSDGRVLDLYQGEIKGTLTPGVVPPLAGANAIAASLDGQSLYILDGREGRIARISRDGSQVAVYKAHRDGKTLTGAREIAVDEATNTAYLLTDEGLVSVRLP
jgi:hypothetical protein